jgi:predicted alpha/beta-fold hydrolase
MEYFMRTLRRKIREKHVMFPGLFDVTNLDAMKTFKEFDDAFTAPLNGFANAEDYWTRASCAPHLPKITRPSLVINARNDPFLSENCYPVRAAEANPVLHLVMPKTGGHVGFPTMFGKTVGWLENTVVDFLEKGKETSICNSRH